MPPERGLVNRLQRLLKSILKRLNGRAARSAPASDQKVGSNGGGASLLGPHPHQQPT